MITFEKVLGLKDVSIFENAPEMALADLACVAQEKTFKAGQEIIPEGKANTSFYVILSGHVRFYDKDVLVEELGPRQFFGETTVFSPAVLPWRIVAQNDVTVLKFSSNELYQMLSLHASLGLGFLRELSRRAYLFQIKKE